MMDVKEKFGWTENPFTLNILPTVFVGYEDEISDIKSHISSKDKLAMLTGPTGSGKTTMLKWISENLSDKDVIYVTKPPKKADDFVTIFQAYYKPSLIDRWFRENVNIYSLPGYIREKSGGRDIVVMIDECHEAEITVLEWLRTLIDQIDESSFIIAGLPVLEDIMHEKLETLYRRVTTKVVLNALTKAETEELIRKRIKNVGGEDIKPFTYDAIEAVYKKTGGFPREVIRVCNELIRLAEKKNLNTIGSELINDVEEISREDEEVKIPKNVNQNIGALPSKQEHLLRVLMEKEWLTPNELASDLLSDYKSEDKAVRSINNILKRLMDQHYIIRKKKDRAYVYAVADKIKTALVNR